MADETPKTATVEADQPHTYNGESYEPGDVYEIDVALLDSIQTQKKAHLVTEKAKAQPRKARKTAKSPAPKGKAKKAIAKKKR